MELGDLVGADRTAVVTMELERGVVGDLAGIPSLAAAAAERSTLQACGRLVAGARAAGVTVVHAIAQWRADRSGTTFNTPLVRSLQGRADQILEGTPAVELVRELGDCSSDLRSIRTDGLGPFTGSDLAELLGAAGVRTVVACGVSLNVGVLGLCLGAAELGYEVVVPTDAVVGVPVDYGDLVLRHTLAAVATLSDVDTILSRWAAQDAPDVR